MIDNIVVTLFEGHYQYGVAALVNSLVASGFNGLVYVGFRGQIPDWTSQLSYISENEYMVSADILIRFQAIKTDMHFGYYKPTFIKQAFKEYPDVNKVFYFDPDIVVIAPWTFYNNWTNIGVALCLDVCFPFVHRNHPWRIEWLKMFNSDTNQSLDIDYYVNSGFIGIRKDAISLIDKWIEFTGKYKQNGGDLSLFEKEAHRIIKGDQDILNAAIQVSSDINLSIIGKEGMGFSYPVYLMAHAVDDVKPWKKNFVKEVVVSGRKPGMASKIFYNYCEYPIRVFPKMILRSKKTQIVVASLIGRFVG